MFVRRSGVLTYGSLFTGIGGIDLGLDRAGWECRWQVESHPHAAAILARHWPGVRRYGDIRSVDGEELEPVDLVCGGFPCQPTSVAGKRRGKADDRWLWPEFARILSGVRPEWALLENPTGLLAFREFGDVLGDLAVLGFDAEWDCVPAASLGAPHVRDRVFVVAHANRQRQLQPEGQQPDIGRRSSDGGKDVADAKGIGEPLRAAAPESHGRPTGGRSLPDPVDLGRGWSGRLGAQGRGWWAAEPNVGRVAHGVPARVDRLERLGNAVVPQVAEFVGRAIRAALNGEAA